MLGKINLRDSGISFSDLALARPCGLDSALLASPLPAMRGDHAGSAPKGSSKDTPIVPFLKFIFLLQLFFLPLSSFAYEPTTTHAGLSQEIVDFYNATHEKKISAQNKELVINGSIEEDDPSLRVINHFYDPIRNIGINNSRTAKDWALENNPENEFSWPKALEYYAKGNEAKAFLALGHIIHLIEDMSVPDHTRNDPHIGVGAGGLYTGESPYEKWTDQNKNRETLAGLYLKYLDSVDKTKNLSSLGEYFDFLANYSNRNFFSADTINLEVYPNPVVLIEGEDYGFGPDSLVLDSHKLYIVTKDKSGTVFKVLGKDNDISVLSDYFDRLAKQTVLTGAGVIELFFKEGEKARAEYLMKQKEDQAREVEVARRLNEKLSGAGNLKLVFYGLGFLTNDNFVQPALGGVLNIANGFGNGLQIIASSVSNGSSMVLYTSKSLATTALEKTAALVLSQYNNSLGAIKNLGKKLSGRRDEVAAVSLATVSDGNDPKSQVTETTVLPITPISPENNSNLAPQRIDEGTSIRPIVTQGAGGQIVLPSPRPIQAVVPNSLISEEDIVSRAAIVFAEERQEKNPSSQTLSQDIALSTDDNIRDTSSLTQPVLTISTTTAIVAKNVTSNESASLVYVATPIPNSEPVRSGGTSSSPLPPVVTVSSTENLSSSNSSPGSSNTLTNNLTSSSTESSSSATSTVTSSGSGGGSSASSTGEILPITVPSPDVTPPLAPIILLPVTSTTIFKYSTINFSGEAEASSTILAKVSGATTLESTTTVSGLGSWSLSFNLGSGASNILFYAIDPSGNTSSSTPLSLSVDTEAPNLSFNVLECNSSISPTSCLTMSSNLNISWSTSAVDLDYYVLDKNGAIEITTSTSSSFTATGDSSPSFAISAVDKAGNHSATSTKTVYISKTPIVINEVAWGGTAGNPADEWIELYNRSSQDIDLSSFTLYSKTDQTPYINLSGVVPAGKYFLIERKNTDELDEATESPIKDIAADLWTSFSFGLSDNGENLILSYASTTVDEVPNCFRWCGLPSQRSYERYDVDSSGSDNSNWNSNTQSIINGLNVSGAPIIGTPKTRNSISYLINKGFNVDQDLTLTKARSPYLVDNITQTISQDKTLTIEPGVIIKFRNAARLSIDGNIIANGTQAESIVFTAFADDDYGGDINGTESPTSGSWYGVELSNKSLGSSFDHAIFRYGGNYGNGNNFKKAMLYAKKVSPSISNSIFEYSKAYGVYLDDSASNVSNNIFRYNTGSTFSAGLYADRGGITLSNNQFKNNDLGAYLTYSNSVVSNNSFENNLTAMSISGSPLPPFTGNTDTTGGFISLTGTITEADATTTLKANPMPYFLSGTVTVAVNSTLDIETGSVIKGSVVGSPSILSVFGKLNIDSPSSDGVVFTSKDEVKTRGSWPGIIMNGGSTSKIKGAIIEAAVTGIKYNGSSPVSLQNVIFRTNITGVHAIFNPSFINVSDVNFTDNGIDKNPSNLW